MLRNIFPRIARSIAQKRYAALPATAVALMLSNCASDPFPIVGDPIQPMRVSRPVSVSADENPEPKYAHSSGTSSSSYASRNRVHSRYEEDYERRIDEQQDRLDELEERERERQQESEERERQRECRERERERRRERNRDRREVERKEEFLHHHKEDLQNALKKKFGR